MTFLSVLAVGFLLGLRHALDADHVAAVGSTRDALKVDRAKPLEPVSPWGIGHTVTLFAVCAAIILSGVCFPGTDRRYPGVPRRANPGRAWG